MSEKLLPTFNGNHNPLLVFLILDFKVRVCSEVPEYAASGSPRLLKVRFFGWILFSFPMIKSWALLYILSKVPYMFSLLL